MTEWKKLSAKIVFQNPYRPIEDWEFQRPDGSVGTYTIATTKEIALVFALTDDDQVIALRQHFIIHGERFLTLVSGFVDGESPIETAKQELLEEAGATAREFISLGSVVRGKYVTGRAHFYLALGARISQPQELEASEDIIVETIPLLEFRRLLYAGEVQDIFPEMCAYRALKHLNAL